mmetsp:Transcript_29240/g.54199  ORF Transcript_29240/g.54199 Transcript_29240/m.54199 type:complete len:336 (-) Transcript_29240:204-1211(-)
MSSNKPLVTITGVTGFLGSHVALLFLQSSSYRVRGTVRSTLDSSKIDPLRKGLGDLFSQLELVEANLLEKESILEAVAGSTYVIHTASPFVLGVKNEDDIVKPAVEGTNAVMEGCKAAGTVKRIVLTSSIAAIFHCDPKDRPADGLFDESCWSDVDRPGGVDPYVKSKTLAEKSAWGFIKSLSEDERMELVVINPGLMYGPFWQTNSFTSAQFMSSILRGEKNPLPRYHDGYSEVRDCALAHVRAIEIPEAKGRRFIMTQGSYWYKEIADMVREQFGPKGWPVVEREASNPDAVIVNFNHQPAEDVLGIEFRPMEETTRDMANCMIESGFVAKPQ